MSKITKKEVELIDDNSNLYEFSRDLILNSRKLVYHKEEFIKEEFVLFSEMNKLQIDEKQRKKSYCVKCKTLGDPKIKTIYKLKKPYKYLVLACKNCGSKNLEHSSNHNTKRKIIEAVTNNLCQK